MQAFIVDPIPNPLDLSSNILLRRYDFPVRYNPATEMIPIGAGIVDINSSTDSFSL